MVVAAVVVAAHSDHHTRTVDTPIGIWIPISGWVWITIVRRWRRSGISRARVSNRRTVPDELRLRTLTVLRRLRRMKRLRRAACVHIDFVGYAESQHGFGSKDRGMAMGQQKPRQCGESSRARADSRARTATRDRADGSAESARSSYRSRLRRTPAGTGCRNQGRLDVHLIAIGQGEVSQRNTEVGNVLASMSHLGIRYFTRNQLPGLRYRDPVDHDGLFQRSRKPVALVVVIGG